MRAYMSSLREEAMAVQEVTVNSFDDVVQKNSIVVVDFWAPWCGPCRNFAPVFEAASEQHKDITFVKINTDDQPELAGAFGIKSIPTLGIFRDQVLLYLEPGSLPEEALSEVIQKTRDIDMAEVHKAIAEDQASQQPK